ncbi:hypothetical protein [Paraburkholderia elongata]|uniref:Uncharacterized protein n=1 Tax=Paraburkholderia elongata TaxID=2675747 RepID=A0A972P0Y1_9BURK|nr:hypothetical protein [Paraburkholderia elongata]NPT58193.1 hypothetical protein [Paraburkholderia elongata]NPT62119.1 hypothetical protein [Paraburkholderia elongata]
MLQWLIGSAVTVLYASDRFENPELTRTTTTFARYWVAKSGYVLIETWLRWPWLLTTFFTTLYIAWTADNHVFVASPVPKWLRIAEAVGLAAFFFFVQLMVMNIFASVQPDFYQQRLRGQLPQIYGNAAFRHFGGAAISHAAFPNETHPGDVRIVGN